jgi:hypothetical protein
MCDAECVPKNYIGVVDTGLAIGNPLWDTFGRLARRLGNMPACRMDLLIVIYKLVSLGKSAVRCWTNIS